jgi:hypothetical protein
MSTSKKIIANRTTDTKATGPRNTKSNRFNPMKHGLLASGLTELDDAERHQTILRDLLREKAPVDTIETFLVEQVALDMVKWETARRLEAQHVTAVLHPPQYENDALGDLVSQFQGEMIDPGIPAAVTPACVECIVTTFQRYQSYHSNRLFRTLHELERSQRMRQGERLPAPMAADLGIHVETGRLDLVPAGPEQAKNLPKDKDGERLPRLVRADVIFSAAATVDAAPASDSHTVLPSDSENSSEPAAVDIVGSASEMGKPPAAEWRPKPPSGPIWQRR